MFWWLAQNTVIAGLMACGVWLACRLTHLRPAGCHALWLVVLVKLMTPPLLFWPWPLPSSWPSMDCALAVWDAEEDALVERTIVPGSVERGGRRGVAGPDTKDPVEGAEPMAAGLERGSAGVGAPAISEPSTARADLLAEAPAPGAGGRWWFERWAALAGGVWLAGFLITAGVELSRIARMRRWIRVSDPAPDWLRREVADLAGKLGRRPPEAVVAACHHAPLVWSFGRPRLLWPERLLTVSSVGFWRGVIVHELAHLRRRDHWVGWLELVAACVWWWNPLFWFVRRRMRESAELACDAWVVALFPNRGRAYAESLLAVCRFISPASEPLAARGLGAASRRALERRLTMILRETVPFRLSRHGLAAAAILGLLTLPSWSQVAADRSAAPEPGRNRGESAAAPTATGRSDTAGPTSGASEYVVLQARAANEAAKTARQARLSDLGKRLEKLKAEFEAIKNQTRESAPGDAASQPESPRQDLQQIQGLWVRADSGGVSLPRLFESGFVSAQSSWRVAKEVKGDTETVTYYDSAGKVVGAHTAKIRLSRAGPLKIFTFHDIAYTAGPKKGKKEEGPKAYVYKVVGDTFVEIWGVLEPSDTRLNVLRWKREKGE